MSVQILLKEVSQISKKYELINQKTGGYFNIFNIANISSDEVTICRIIYELINPKGSHYQGDTYLRLFIKEVLKLEISEQEYKNAIVYREQVIKDDRRVDLVIKTGNRVIPIEVKVYAGDQPKQCFDYYKYAKNSNVFYLTLDGKCPSEYSAEGLNSIQDDSNEVIGYKEVTQISFEIDILNWLNKCVSHHETIKIAPIREIILQFMEVIRNMTNVSSLEKEDEIVEILSSKENIRTAIELEKGLKSCKIQMIKKVLEGIEKRIDKEFEEKYKLPHYSYKENNYAPVKNYYNKKSSTYPAINYFIKSLDKEDVDLLLRIEIDHHIFVGFCTLYKEKPSGKILSDDEIKELINDDGSHINGWWICWEYIYNKTMECPNFKNFNDAYFDLFDDNKFDEFMDLCEISILSMLGKLKDKQCINTFI